MRVPEMRYLLEAGMPAGCMADTEVRHQPIGKSSDGAVHVKCHAMAVSCPTESPGGSTGTVADLVNDSSVFPDGTGGGVVFCSYCCSHDDGFNAVARQFHMPSGTAISFALADVDARVARLAEPDPRERNEALRVLRRPLPDRVSWQTGPDDPVWLWYLGKLTSARDLAEDHAARVRASWSGPLHLVALATGQRKRAWAEPSKDAELDAALAAAQTVEVLDLGLPVAAVPAELARRDDDWADLGPAVAGEALQVRLAAINAASDYGLPHQANLDDIVAATAAAVA